MKLHQLNIKGFNPFTNTSMLLVREEESIVVIELQQTIEELINENNTNEVTFLEDRNNGFVTFTN